ncbi:MAG: hypothetical protein ACI39U_02570 [Candidatus Cryptobacteroides sp.]
MNGFRLKPQSLSVFIFRQSAKPLKMASIFSLFVVALILLSSCSVKEDRSGCPCMLMLDFESVRTVSPEAGLLLSANMDGNCVVMDSVNLAEFEGPYEMEVPRGVVNLNVWSDEALDYVSEGQLSIPLGDDCPQVRMFSETLDLRDADSRAVEVRLCKNHCLLSICFKGEDGRDEGFVTGVRGNVDGYACDGRPRLGEFFHFMSTPMKLVLPRQTDSSLKLDVIGREGLLKSFALGNYLAASGYDWTAADLQDASVTVDFTCTKILISVGAWDSSYDFDIVF